MNASTSKRRTLFLDVDNTLISSRVTQAERWSGWLANETVQPRPRLSRERAIDPTMPHGGVSSAYYRPRVIGLIQRLPEELDIRWLTSWMVGPEALQELQRLLGLPSYRFRPATLPNGIEPSRTGIPHREVQSHWKVHVVRAALEADPAAQVLWCDDEISTAVITSFQADARSRLHWLLPGRRAGMLTEADLMRADRWARGQVEVLRSALPW